MIPNLKIVIEAPDGCDFTPLGKRAARVVPLDRGAKMIRLYVGGKIFRQLGVTRENAALTELWLNSKSTHPQPFEAAP